VIAKCAACQTGRPPRRHEHLRRRVRHAEALGHEVRDRALPGDLDAVHGTSGCSAENAASASRAAALIPQVAPCFSHTAPGVASTRRELDPDS
jgi:hypothetical protein